MYFFQGGVTTVKKRRRFLPKSHGKESRVRRALALVRGGKHYLRGAALQYDPKYMYDYTCIGAIAGRWKSAVGLVEHPSSMTQKRPLPDFIKDIVDRREGRTTQFSVY